MLSSFKDEVWGPDLFGTISMSALQAESGTTNNDFLFNIRNCRMVSVVENSDKKPMNEELFKKVSIVSLSFIFEIENLPFVL